MNKLLVTGLSLGKDIGICSVCNFDFEWMIKYPSVFMWADKILVPQSIWNTVTTADNYPGCTEELSKSIKLVFDIAESENIVEIVKPSDVINNIVSKNIEKEVDTDRIQFTKYLPDHVATDEKDIPGGLIVDGKEYCGPYIATIYAALYLAKTWDANCLFNDRVFNYCKYKFGLSGFLQNSSPVINESFQSIFQTFVPNYDIFPAYVYENKEKCNECVKTKSCKDTFLSEVERNIKKIFSWRYYDEIQNVKQIVNEIIHKRKELGDNLIPSEIMMDFDKRKEKMQRQLKLVFPKIKRWSNVIMMASTPIAMAGLFSSSSNPMVTNSAAILTGSALVAKEAIDYFSSKYSWIGFMNKHMP